MMIGFRADDRLTVIGGASIDTLERHDGAVRTGGGAGLYTALAARRAGLDVTMLAPRPEPLPPELTAAIELLDWRGPQVSPDGIPHFHIEYEADGTRLLRIENPGTEGDLIPDQVLEELPNGPVCIIPLTDPRLQLDFVRRLKDHGRWVACGTYPCGTREHTDVVRETLAAADAFFCNQEEAEVLFGSLSQIRSTPGKLLFVTRGRDGVSIVQGDHVTELAAVEAAEVDPTGAGDAFCGATLAELARGRHPVQAAKLGVAVASQVVREVGPAALLVDEKPPGISRDSRLELDSRRIGTVADWLASAPQVAGFDFCGADFPQPGDPGTLDFFFAQTLQQFGFWVEESGRYRQPMIAPLGGRERKGSDYLWAVYSRWLDEDPAGLKPASQQRLERQALDFRYRSDTGTNPVPASDLHWRLARSYGSDMQQLGTSPEELVAEANAAEKPVAALLRLLDHLGGYKEDPLRKKSALLALVLRQRPEQFLRAVEGDDLPPIVDYHIQRSCLRMGLVEVKDDGLEHRLSARQVLSREDEAAVREACYQAVAEVQRISCRSMAAVDWFFFQNRRRCPEMTQPDCPRCEVETVCARRKELFQPVLRTTFY